MADFDFAAVCRAWQADMTAAREAWDHRTAPQAPAEDEEDDDMPARFEIDFPAPLSERAAVAEFLKETAIRTGPGDKPPQVFLRALAAAAENGGPVDTAGLSRDDRQTIRRVLYVANDRARTNAPNIGAAIPPFMGRLLAAWEAHINFRAPHPKAAVDRYGEEVRPGGGVTPISRDEAFRGVFG